MPFTRRTAALILCFSLLWITALPAVSPQLRVAIEIDRDFCEALLADQTICIPEPSSCCMATPDCAPPPACAPEPEQPDCPIELTCCLCIICTTAGDALPAQLTPPDHPQTSILLAAPNPFGHTQVPSRSIPIERPPDRPSVAPHISSTVLLC